MKVPYRDACLLHYPQDWYSYEDGKPHCHSPEWREAEPFAATLQLDGMQRGRSAAYFMWRNVFSDATYPMFMKDMADLIQGGITIQDGLVFAMFEPCKRGTNYGIRVAR